LAWQYTIKTIWIHMLYQIDRISADAAEAIAEAYPTPALLMKAYAQAPDERAR
jgi:ERCC4-type nuclease